MTDPERSPSWKMVAALIRQLHGRHAGASSKRDDMKCSQNFQPERSAGGQSADRDADLADPETGGAATEPQRVLVGQAPARGRRPALHQAGRRDPLRGSLPPAVDEGPAAHLDQRMIQGVNDSKYKERVRATILAPFSFGLVIIVHLCTSVYIDVTQYS